MVSGAHISNGSVDELLAQVGLPRAIRSNTPSDEADRIIEARQLIALRRGVVAFHGEEAAKAVDDTIANCPLLTVRAVSDALFRLQGFNWHIHYESNSFEDNSLDSFEISLSGALCSSESTREYCQVYERLREESEKVREEFYYAPKGGTQPDCRNWNSF